MMLSDQLLSIRRSVMLDEVRSDQIRSDQIRSDQVRSCQLYIQKLVEVEGIHTVETYWEMSRKHNWPPLQGYPTGSRCFASLYK